MSGAEAGGAAGGEAAGGAGSWEASSGHAGREPGGRGPVGGPGIRALAITVSNRASAGVYEDKSGPVLAGLLAEAGCAVDGPLVIPDGDPVETALRDGSRPATG
jgi:hypothetical protein